MQIMRVFSGIMAALFTCLAALLPGRVWLPPLERTGEEVSVGAYVLAYDTASGTFSVCKDGATLFADAYCEYARDGRTVSSREYTDFSVSRSEDGGETELIVFMRGEGLWDLTQSFRFAADRAWFTTRVTLGAPEGVRTNSIAPLVIPEKKLRNFEDRLTNVLETPFDNDGWAEFRVKGLGEDAVSYEVGAVFAPENGGGLVLGSLEHDLWKSAVRTRGAGSRLGELRLACGEVDPRQGGEPHGTVSGESVSSPLMFIGLFDDWREGLTAFARANTAAQPKRAPVGDGVPFGWNSWGSVQTDLSYALAAETSDYIKARLQPAWQADGADVYVNLDSYLDNLSDAELKAFADHCRANGQKVGVYFSPFVVWWDAYGMSVSRVPGTDLTYQDIRLKKHDGAYYGNGFDGCFPLDVTHPATKLHVKDRIDRLKAAGFDYIKLDFLVHATFEGDYYDPAIRTGIEAYNYAMTYLTEMLGGDVFINLAMSPIFPYQYANGRRLACDSFYGIGDTEYTLNAVTYGFWEKELYDYPDPDHLVVWGRDAGATEAEARSRVTCGAIAGTSFLAGDNFVSPADDADAAFKRYEKLLTNPGVIAAAKTGAVFTPVVTGRRDRAAHVYRLETETGAYLAVFNFSGLLRTFTVDTGFSRYAAEELWRGKKSVGARYLTVTLGPGDAALFEITRK